jgi:hypothetical protein
VSTCARWSMAWRDSSIYSRGGLMGGPPKRLG